MPVYAFKYRLPGARLSCGSWSRRCMEQPVGKGFLISPFLPHSSKIFIPLELVCLPDTFERAFMENGEGREYVFPSRSTTYDEYAAEVCSIVDLENKGELDKAVAARCLIADGVRDVDRLFDALCAKYPEAFVFLFSTPETGTWIGATPELLLEDKEGELRSMALAGTRKSGEDGDWDDKNESEQAIVCQYIADAFREFDLTPCISEREVRKAGPVEHLMNIVTAKCPDTVDMTQLLDRLAPTPALCGLPRKAAADVTADCESFARAFYGGYCGPWYGDDDFNLYVILRCAWISKHRSCLFAGGGIMPCSDSDDEWRETERKLETLRDAMKC